MELQHITIVYIGKTAHPSRLPIGCPLKVLERSVNQSFLEPAVVGWKHPINAREWGPLFQDASFIGKLSQPVNTVRLAQAGMVTAAKGQVTIEKVHQAVVDTRHTSSRMVDNVLRIGIAGRVNVHGERLFLGIDERNGLVQNGKRDNG